MGPSSMCLLFSAPVLFHPGTIIPAGIYRPDPNLAYLTGVSQPDCAALLEVLADGEVHYTLLTPPEDAWNETWNGPRLRSNEAMSFFGADATAPTSMLGAVLERALRTARAGVLWDGPTPGVQLSHVAERALDAARIGRGPSFRVGPGLAAALGEMRWLKSPAEVRLMRASARASAEGILAAAASVRAGALETAAAAAHEFVTRRAGAQRLAYPSVAAAGPSACVIHYSRSDRVVREGDAFLLDAGCELQGYCSDVTRTWPVSGEFSSPQAAVYDAVAQAHAACIQATVEGATLQDVHALSVTSLAASISRLGLAPGLSATAVARGPYRALYPHSVGHWLGLDTHDTPTVPHSRPLRQGVVLTIEPGLYIPLDSDAPPEFRGIGVRIEDDILIGSDGRPEVLSAPLPSDLEGAQRLPLLGSQRFGELATVARSSCFFGRPLVRAAW